MTPVVVTHFPSAAALNFHHSRNGRFLRRVHHHSTGRDVAEMQSLESRVLLSAATYAVSKTWLFTGVSGNGEPPVGNLVIDGSGDIFGQSWGAPGPEYTDCDAEIFEIPAGASAPTTLHDWTDDLLPNAIATTTSGSVVAIATEEEFGALWFYGANSPGGPLPNDEYGAQIDMNASGNGLWLDDYTPYDVTNGSLTSTLLTPFGADSGVITAVAAVDGSGNLFGIPAGPASTAPSIWEIPSGDTSATVTVNSSTSVMGSGFTSLITDSAGDVFGVSSSGGANGTGTIFELPAGGSSVIKLADFPAGWSSGMPSKSAAYQNYPNPNSAIVIDSSGDLFGVDNKGNGGVWELAAGASKPSIIYTVSGVPGSITGGLAIDGDGNLYGATTTNDLSDAYLASGEGSVFELSPQQQPARLAFAQQPTSSAAGAAISPAITIDVEDSSGNIVSSDDSAVTLSIASGPDGAVFSGTATVNAVNGVATFSGLSLSDAGTYTFSATDGSLSGATSNAFTISSGSTGTGGSPAVPSQLAIATAPTDSAAGESQSISLNVEDSSGTTVTSSHPVLTIQLQANGKTVKIYHTRAKDGVATIRNLSTTKAGTYTLVASDGKSVSPVTSGSFTVSSGAATHMKFQQVPKTATSGQAFGVEVELLDKYGNVATAASSSVTIGLAGHTSVLLNGGVNQQAVNGIVTFNNLTIDQPGKYRLIAQGSAGQAVRSDPIRVS